jgi:hypothetical protein
MSSSRYGSLSVPYSSPTQCRGQAIGVPDTSAIWTVSCALLLPYNSRS